MADKTIICKECESKFVFSDSEQEFYKEKGFENEPQRCPDCRAAKKAQRRGGGNRGFSNNNREMHSATCAECGIETMVPFKPSGDKPVYCKDCYQSKRRY